MVRKKVSIMRRVRLAAIAVVMVLAGSYTFGGIAPRIASAIADSGIVSQDGSYIVNDVLRIQTLSDTVVRLEQKGKKGFEDRKTYYVPHRNDFKRVQSEHTSDNDNFYITTKSYAVKIPKSATSLSGVTVTDKQGNELYSYGGETTPNTYLPSPSDELKSWYFSDSPRIVPSESGYSNIGTDEEFNGWDFENDAPDMYVFLPDGDYKQFCSDYIKLTGPSELIDLKMLGYWDSRWYAYSADTALQQIRDYHDRGYSIDMLVIDTDWRDASQGVGYDINTKLFPDMADFMDKAHNLGVNIIFNDHPEPRNNGGNALESVEIDYRSKNLKLIMSLGLDYWWYDRNWHVALNKVDPEGEISVFAFGMYAFQFITEEYYNSIADVKEYARRALIMGNVDGCLHGNWKYASDISAHRYSIQWTGDIGSDTVALKKEIRNSVFGGAENGLPYMSSDIGGHTQPVTDNMYTRWMQYGALSTVCRVHCTHKDYIGQEGRMPWMFGDTAEAVTKEYVGMRYRLLPLYYNLAAENYSTGLPILRRLDIEYPQYVEASRNDEYLLGDGILVAPIDAAGMEKSAPAAMFSCLADGSVRAGLKGEYYNNTSLSGSPAFTKVDTDYLFDWGSGGPGNGLGSDNFSVRWSGSFTVGNIDTRLQFYADDSVKVIIDGTVVIDSTTAGDNGESVYDRLLSSPYYSAGSKHTVEIEYVEEGGQAHFYMYANRKPVKGESVCYNTRTVFIPDGVWTDVWTGKTYTGPKTYSVTHGLETSPIFVKQGTVAVLADNMVNTAEKDWSNVTLDVYPTLTGEAKARLYEDDTETVAYKYGESRTTDIVMKYDGDKNVLRIDIGAAQGEFNGKKAFDTRTWNVRVHAYEQLGEVTGIKVNGKSKSLGYFIRSASASPFAFSGAAPDTDVFIAEFTSSVKTGSVIEITFENMSAFKTVAANEKSDYDNTAADFTVNIESAGNMINLDNEDIIEWAYFGADENTTARKKGVSQRLIGEITSNFETSAANNSPLLANWTNADGVDSATFTSGAVAGEVDLKLKLGVQEGNKRNYYLYLSGENCIAKLSVRDRAGSVRTLTFGNTNGRFLYRAVISAEAEKATQLDITYMAYSTVPDGTGCKSRVMMSAVAVSEKNLPTQNAPFADVKASQYSVETINAVTNVNISARDTALNCEVKDWFKSGDVDGQKWIYKSGANDIASVKFSSSQQFNDYAANISWSGGEEVASNSGTRVGQCTSGAGEISIIVDVDASTKYIRLYTGCWRSTNNITVYDVTGNVLCRSTSFAAGDSSVCKAVTFRINAQGKSRIRIVINSSAEGASGNISLSAATVLG